MTLFLRFVGMMNAAVWMGTAVFYTVVVWPAFSSPAMVYFLTEPYAGVASHLVMARYFQVHLVCGIIALLHLTVEWLYTGKPMQKITFWLMAGLLGLSLLGYNVLQPRLNKYHTQRNSPQVAAEVQDRGHSSYRTVKGVTLVANFLLTVGVVVFTWRISTPPVVPRFSSPTRFRS